MGNEHADPSPPTLPCRSKPNITWQSGSRPRSSTDIGIFAACLEHFRPRSRATPDTCYNILQPVARRRVEQTDFTHMIWPLPWESLRPTFAHVPMLRRHPGTLRIRTMHRQVLQVTHKEPLIELPWRAHLSPCWTISNICRRTWLKLRRFVFFLTPTCRGVAGIGTARERVREAEPQTGVTH